MSNAANLRRPHNDSEAERIRAAPAPRYFGRDIRAA